MANVFTKLPKFKYQVDEYNFFAAPDITVTAKIKDAINSYRGVIYLKYIVKNGERPDQVAYKVYGRSNLDWLVMMTNDIIDPYNQWAQPDYQINQSLIRKYGTLQNAVSTIVEYRNADGLIIDKETYNTLPLGQKTRLTAAEKAFEENRIKSHIRVLKKDVALQIEAQMFDLLRTSRSN